MCPCYWVGAAQVSLLGACAHHLPDTVCDLCPSDGQNGKCFLLICHLPLTLLLVGLGCWNIGEEKCGGPAEPGDLGFHLMSPLGAGPPAGLVLGLFCPSSGSYLPLILERTAEGRAATGGHQVGSRELAVRARCGPQASWPRVHRLWRPLTK